MSLSHEEMDRVINDHFMFEATDDVDGVLASLTDDVQHHVVGSPWGPLSGKAAVRPFYEQLFADLKGEGVEPLGAATATTSWSTRCSGPATSPTAGSSDSLASRAR